MRKVVVIPLVALVLILLLLYLNTRTVDYVPSTEIIYAHFNKCESPSSGFKAWNQGVITVIYPEIKKNCSKIISGDKEETSKITHLSLDWNKHFSQGADIEQGNMQLSKNISNCDWLAEYVTNNLYITKLEVSFPIAFSFLVHDSPQQFLRLFKVLYRPHNVYCIHPDKKSSFRPFFSNLAKCFHNVIIASSLMDVQWSKYTMMDAQVQCFSDLIAYRKAQEEDKRWKYVINLCGKELPLLSNKEMVKKLLFMNGTSSVVGWPAESWATRRLRKKMLPFNLTFYKSSTFNALSERFVDFMVTDPKAQHLYKFLRDTDFPEEHFYPTLFRMPGAPGGYNPLIKDEDYFEVGHTFWRTNRAEISLRCVGETVHGICVVNHADIPRILRETRNGSTALFQNKYFMEKNHVIMDCMEERIVAMNKLEYKLDCK